MISPHSSKCFRIYSSMQDRGKLRTATGKASSGSNGSSTFIRSRREDFLLRHDGALGRRRGLGLRRRHVLRLGEEVNPFPTKSTPCSRPGPAFPSQYSLPTAWEWR